jgi:tetratricopeptide (TPR) repeat protein
LASGNAVRLSLRASTTAILCACAIVQTVSAGDLALDLADGLSQAGNHWEAVTEYRRFIFFAADRTAIGEAYARLAAAYRSEGHFAEAEEALRRSIAVSESDSARDECRIQIAVIRIAAEDYSAAELELLRVSAFSKSEPLARKATFHLGVCYLYNYRSREAMEAFGTYFTAADNTLAAAYPLSGERWPAMKSPDLAEWLSTFVPGSGQIYAGDAADGANALAVNLGTGYLVADALVGNRYSEAALVFGPIFLRYYLGNRENAARIANERNEERNKAFAAQALRHVSRLLGD